MHSKSRKRADKSRALANNRGDRAALAEARLHQRTGDASPRSGGDEPSSRQGQASFQERWRFAVIYKGGIGNFGCYQNRNYCRTSDAGQFGRCFCRIVAIPPTLKQCPASRMQSLVTATAKPFGRGQQPERIELATKKWRGMSLPCRLLTPIRTATSIRSNLWMLAERASCKGHPITPTRRKPTTSCFHRGR